MDIITAVRAFYLTCASIILAAYAFPVLRAPLFTYGSRSTKPDTQQNGFTLDGNTTADGAKDTSSANDRSSTSPATTAPRTSLLTKLASLQVPHSWFTHFYILSTILSLFWFHQLITRGPIFQLIASHTNPTYTPSSTIPPTSMTLGQTYLVLVLFLIQSVRRLIESFVFLPSSRASPSPASTMHLTHYALGLSFYIIDNLAIWLEGVPALLAKSQCPFPHVELTQPKFLIAIAVFLAASTVQNRAHAHLAALRASESSTSTSSSGPVSSMSTSSSKYHLPTAWMFRYVVCPHYTAEVMIYICLAIVAAPRAGTWMGMGLGLNGTMGAAVVFVGVNLGVTADGTRGWYVRMFGEERVKGRRRIVPGVW